MLFGLRSSASLSLVRLALTIDIIPRSKRSCQHPGPKNSKIRAEAPSWPVLNLLGPSATEAGFPVPPQSAGPSGLHVFSLHWVGLWPHLIDLFRLLQAILRFPADLIVEEGAMIVARRSKVSSTFGLKVIEATTQAARFDERL